MAHDHVRTNTYGMSTYNTRELIIRDDILAKAGELADLISTSEEVQMFKQAEEDPEPRTGPKPDQNH